MPPASSRADWPPAGPGQAVRRRRAVRQRRGGTGTGRPATRGTPRPRRGRPPPRAAGTFPRNVRRRPLGARACGGGADGGRLTGSVGRRADRQRRGRQRRHRRRRGRAAAAIDARIGGRVAEAARRPQGPRPAHRRPPGCRRRRGRPPGSGRRPSPCRARRPARTRPPSPAHRPAAARWSGPSRRRPPRRPRPPLRRCAGLRRGCVQRYVASGAAASAPSRRGRGVRLPTCCRICSRRRPRRLRPGIERRRQRPPQHGAHLRRQPAADHDHPVVVHPGVEGARLVPPPVLRLLGRAVDPAPRADHLLDMRGGAGEGDVEQRLLGRGSCHAGDGAHLRVGDGAAPQRLAQPRQLRQGVGDAHLLAGGARREADAPAQPVGAGGEAFPAVALVELADEDEQLVGGGLDAGGEVGYPVAECLDAGRGLVGSRRLRGRDVGLGSRSGRWGRRDGRDGQAAGLDRHW